MTSMQGSPMDEKATHVTMATMMEKKEYKTRESDLTLGTAPLYASSKSLGTSSYGRDSSSNEEGHGDCGSGDEDVVCELGEIQEEDRMDTTINGEQFENRYTFWQAVGFNCMNMFGTGPFISYPYCIASVNPPGTQAMIGYGATVLGCFADSFVWGELGSMWPHSGGSYVYLRELYGPETWGRLAAFMFIWQFFISGPAELASGFIAMADYLSYVIGISHFWIRVPMALGFLLVCFAMLYRKIDDVGKLTVALWAITIFTVSFTIIAGFVHLNPDYLQAPPGAFSDPGRFVLSMAAATRFGIYDMTGYYDVCQMGGEVRNPRKTIPLSCISTCLVVGVVCVLAYVAIGGVMPPYGEDGFLARIEAGEGVYIMSDFAEKLFGREFAIFFTVLVAVTIFGSNFSMLCGFQYIPSTAAEDGYFFQIFAHRSEKHGGLADVSLIFVTIVTAIFCFFEFTLVVEAMTTMLVLVQFLGQSVGLMYYRRVTPADKIPESFKMPYYPWPCIVQIVLFLFIFVTTDNYLIAGGNPILELSIVFLLFGAGLFFARAKIRKEWPFRVTVPEEEEGQQQQEEEAAECGHYTLEKNLKEESEEEPTEQPYEEEEEEVDENSAPAKDEEEAVMAFIAQENLVMPNNEVDDKLEEDAYVVREESETTKEVDEEENEAATLDEEEALVAVVEENLPEEKTVKNLPEEEKTVENLPEEKEAVENLPEEKAVENLPGEKTEEQGEQPQVEEPQENMGTKAEEAVTVVQEKVVEDVVDKAEDDSYVAGEPQIGGTII